MKVDSYFYALLVPAIIFVGLLFGGFFDDTYEKLRPNENESYMSDREFEWACGKDYSFKDTMKGFECSTRYLNRMESTRRFRKLVHSLDDLYANGFFFHCYAFDSKRTYICCDKDRKRIVATWKKIDYYTHYEYKISLVVETL